MIRRRVRMDWVLCKLAWTAVFGRNRFEGDRFERAVALGEEYQRLKSGQSTEQGVS